MVILGVLINETCYKTGRVSTRDFTVIQGPEACPRIITSLHDNVPLSFLFDPS